MRRLAGLLPLLAACSAAAPGAGTRGVEPLRAILYEETLTVEMSDGSLCVGLRGGQGRSFSGRLQGCPHPWPFAATLPPSRTARLVLGRGTGGPAHAGISGPAGRDWSFSAGGAES
jgi:hypothetical protein